MSDIEIAQKAKKKPIIELTREHYGIDSEHLEPYGHYKAKLSLEFIDSLKKNKDGKLILVTAITPTPAGEGKTTTTVGLGDAMSARTLAGSVLRRQGRCRRRRSCPGRADGRHQPAFHR